MRTVRMLLALVAVAVLGGCMPLLYQPKWHPEGPAQVEEWVDEFPEPGRPPSRLEWSPNKGLYSPCHYHPASVSHKST